jgi:hypothetical protein
MAAAVAALAWARTGSPLPQEGRGEIDNLDIASG